MESDEFLDRATKFASLAHQGQERNGKPYIEHPKRVAAMVVHLGTDLAIIGLLHDVLEDCEVPSWIIEYEFGEKTAGTVETLTRQENESYNEYINRVCQDRRAAIVKYADMCDNISEADEYPTAVNLSLKERYKAFLPRIKEAAGFIQASFDKTI